MKEHDGHRCGQLQEAAKRDRKFVQFKLGLINTKAALFKNSLEELKEYEKEVIKSVKNLEEAIENQQEQLHHLVDKACEEILHQVEGYKNGEIDRLETLKVEHQNTLNKIQNTCEFTNNLLTHGQDVEFLSLKGQVMQQLTDLQDLAPSAIEQKLQLTYSHVNVIEEDIQLMLGQVNGKMATFKRMTGDSLTTKQISHDAPLPPRQIISYPTKTKEDKKGCCPTSVTTNSDDDVIIVDDINKKIKIFYNNGDLKTQITPEGENKLVDPWGVAVTKDGNIAVTDRSTRDVKIFTYEGEFVSSFGKHLRSPWGIAVNSNGDIIVTDTGAKNVFVHDLEGKLLYSLDNDPENPMFLCPEYVTVNQNDDIIVSDFEKHCIKVFDSQGRLLYDYGTRGKVNGSFDVPCGVCTDTQENILIADYQNQRIHLLSPEGQFKCFPVTSENGIKWPQAIAVDSHANLIVVDGNIVKVFRYHLPEDTVINNETLLQLTAIYDVPKNTLIQNGNGQLSP